MGERFPCRLDLPGSDNGDFSRPRHYARPIASRDTNIGAKRAREAREELGFDQAGPIECLLTTVESDLGVPVILARLHEDVAGCCWRDDKAGVVLWVNGRQPAVRQRFTLAHELGHLRCGHDGSIQVDTFRTLSGKDTDSREVQANAFAAELLVPAAGLRAEFADREPTLEDVVGIAKRFRVSAQVAIFRLNTLALAARYEELREELEAESDAIWQELEKDPGDDLIARACDDLPRISESLRSSPLARMVEGSIAAEDAAAITGRDRGAVIAAAEAIGI